MNNKLQELNKATLDQCQLYRVLLGALVKKAEGETLTVTITDIEKTHKQILLMEEMENGIKLSFEKK